MNSNKLFLYIILLNLFSLFSFGQRINNGKITYVLGDTSSLKSADAKILSKKNLTFSSESGSYVITSVPLAIPLDEFGEFVSFGLSLGYTGLDSLTEVKVRAADKSGTWNNWFELEAIDVIEEESNMFRSELYFLNNNYRFVQFKIVFIGKESDSSIIKKINLFFSSPLPKIEQKKPTKSRDSIIADTTGLSVKAFTRPEYVLRKDWGCPQDENTTARELTDVTHLIVHHSAGSNNASDYSAVVLSYWDYHVNGNGWDDIGYNWLVDPDGVIYKGRAWYDEAQENVKGAHNSGKNSGTAGMCLIGDFREDIVPTSNMWNSAWEMLAFLCYRYELDPLAVTYHEAIDRDNDVITGHRDSGGGTVCPGDVANSYEATRQVVADKLAGTFNPGPTDLETDIPACPDTAVSFYWNNSGMAWQINISEDPLFGSHYVKWVSGLTSYTGPAGFVLYPDNEVPLENFKEDTRYFWRMYYQDRKTPTYSFTMPACSASDIPLAFKKQQGIMVYPNPSNGSFAITLSSSPQSAYSITLINIAGQILLEEKGVGNEFNISEPELPGGIYILRVNTGKKLLNSTVIIR